MCPKFAELHASRRFLILQYLKRVYLYFGPLALKLGKLTSGFTVLHLLLLLQLNIMIIKTKQHQFDLLS